MFEILNSSSLSKPRILLAEDDYLTLESFADTLRSLESVWEVTLAKGYARAMAELRSNDYAVVVSSLSHPEEDRLRLLLKTREVDPAIGRLVLSVEEEEEMTLRSVGAAHQYLAKLCKPSELVSAIHRSLSIRSSLENPKLKHLLSRLKHIPSHPQLSQELLTELRSDRSVKQRLCDIIGRDIGMMTRILQIANSDEITAKNGIASVEEAVDALGVEGVRGLVLSLDVFDSIGVFETDGLQNHIAEHSLKVAFCAKQIAYADTGDKGFAQECFTAGFLHDVGRLVLVANLPDYGELLSSIHLDEWNIVTIFERNCFGATHVEVGAALLRMWGVPDSIVESVLYHSEPRACGSSERSPLPYVHVANCLQNQYVGGDIDPSAILGIDLDYIESIGKVSSLTDWMILADVSNATGLARRFFEYRSECGWKSAESSF